MPIIKIKPNTDDDHIISVSLSLPVILGFKEIPRKLNFDLPNFNVSSMT